MKKHNPIVHFWRRSASDAHKYQYLMSKPLKDEWKSENLEEIIKINEERGTMTVGELKKVISIYDTTKWKFIDVAFKEIDPYTNDRILLIETATNKEGHSYLQITIQRMEKC